MKLENNCYLDCNATTPIDPRVAKIAQQYLIEDFGNPGSRTHKYGNNAKKAVQKARNQIAKVVHAQREEVIFTSGATESNNLALLGLAEYGKKNRKKHIISTLIEHKAVLEPINQLVKDGFEVTLLSPNSGGWIDPQDVKKALRPDTLLVSIMHVNNETGVIQPISEISNILTQHEAYFHCDAAQGFGKEILPLQSSRIDMLSISGHHKLYAPKGIGALICRRRNYRMPPIKPLMLGGGQERGLRPGTLPVYAIVSLGASAELALRELKKREDKCRNFKIKMLEALSPLNPIIHGDPDRTMAHVVNLSFAGLNSEAVMVALKSIVSISNGSACTSSSYEPSHVLKAMGMNEDEISTALRWSWCYLSETPDWNIVTKAIKQIL